MASMRHHFVAMASALSSVMFLSGCATKPADVVGSSHELYAHGTIEFRQTAEEVIPDKQQLSSGVENAYEYLSGTGALALAYEKIRSYQLRILFINFGVHGGYSPESHRVFGDAKPDKPDFACIGISDRSMALVSNITFQPGTENLPTQGPVRMESENPTSLYFLKVPRQNADLSKTLSELLLPSASRTYEAVSNDGATVSVLIVSEGYRSTAWSTINGLPFLTEEEAKSDPVMRKFDATATLFADAWRLFGGLMGGRP